MTLVSACTVQARCEINDQLQRFFHARCQIHTYASMHVPSISAITSFFFIASFTAFSSTATIIISAYSFCMKRDHACCDSVYNLSTFISLFCSAILLSISFFCSAILLSISFFCSANLPSMDCFNSVISIV